MHGAVTMCLFAHTKYRYCVLTQHVHSSDVKFLFYKSTGL